MFTGIVEEIGSIRAINSAGSSMTVQYNASIVLDGTAVGDSIAVNGVCQTVKELFSGGFTADVSGETIKKTTAGNLKSRDHVNLERALQFGDRLGGHLVQGHVNSTALIERIIWKNSMIRLTLQIPQEQMKYIIPEGSVCIDGISLTATEVRKEHNSIDLQIIPHTFENTTLVDRSCGDKVNLETDMLGRYVESLLKPYSKESLSVEKLKIWGY